MRFVRTAPRLLPAHLIPEDSDAAAWLGLIQHYGGPTRLLDVTRSPYIALFFAFEATGAHERVVWAIDDKWCTEASAMRMANAEGAELSEMLDRIIGSQRELLYSLVFGLPADPRFTSFRSFTGVFLLDPWKPDTRQSAQQARFLCAANPSLSFIGNLVVCNPNATVARRFVLPAALRAEAIERLAVMNITAATLFPDLSGLARSLRTHGIRR